MKKFLFLFFVLLPVFLFAKESDVYIGLSSRYNPSNLPKIGLAANNPSDITPQEEKLYSNLFAEVLRSDLYRSRYFNIEEAAPAQVSALGPQLANLQKKNILYYVFFDFADQILCQNNIIFYASPAFKRPNKCLSCEFSVFTTLICNIRHFQIIFFHHSVDNSSIYFLKLFNACGVILSSTI